MSMLYPYGDQPDPTPEDPYPYEDYYGHGSGRPPRRCRRNRGGWWLLLLLVVVIGGVVAVLSRFSVNLRQTSSGVTLSIQSPSSSSDAETQAAETAGDDLAILQPSGDITGSGAQLMVTETPTPLPETPSDGGQGLSLQAIYRKCIPSVVSITATSSNAVSTGTGIIMSSDGYIITNSHVIEGSSRLEVVLQDERVFDALLVGRDVPSDLAVLKIECDGLSPAQFGDSSLLVVGDPVVAIGNPLGEELRGTMTDGIISAINRDVNVDGYTMSLLQTTAALNSGNSGGALINDHGQVVGITNLKMEGYDSTVEGLGFAIPTTTVKEVVDALIAYGQVENRPTIGITGYTVTAEMAAGFDGPQGVAVQTVREGSDAQMQGILPGDIIVEANGETITTMEQLQALKDSLSVGDVLSLRIWRSGHYLERDVTLVDQYTLDE